MAQRLQPGFWPGNQRDIIETCAQKRHLVSNLFALGARVVVASRLTIVSPCGIRREGSLRKLLGALVVGEPLSLASSSRASAALRSLFE